MQNYFFTYHCYYIHIHNSSLSTARHRREKKEMFLKYFVILVILAVNLHGLDYCDKSLCQKGKHIACNARTTFKSSCPSGIRLVSMNTAMQNIFLNHHNLVRDLVAGGKHPRGFERATRMCSMVSD